MNNDPSDTSDQVIGLVNSLLLQKRESINRMEQQVEVTTLNLRLVIQKDGGKTTYKARLKISNGDDNVEIIRGESGECIGQPKFGRKIKVAQNKPEPATAVQS